MPKYGETYFSIYKNQVTQHTWRDDFADRMQFELGNCYPTRAEAKKHLTPDVPEEYFDPKRDFADNALGKSCLVRNKQNNADKISKYYYRKRKQCRKSNYVN